MERNHTVQIGDIFEKSTGFEMYSSHSFYQVVRLKGKTMVECRKLCREYLVDESCNSNIQECIVKPLPGQFDPEDELHVFRVYGSTIGVPEGEIAYCLHTVGGYFRDYLYPYHENKQFTCTGYGSPFDAKTWKVGAHFEGADGGPLTTILPII